MNSSTATILLHRRINVVQPALFYRVIVDEQQVARLAVSQRRTVGVAPGRHTLQARVLWMSSPNWLSMLPTANRCRSISDPTSGICGTWRSGLAASSASTRSKTKPLRPWEPYRECSSVTAR